MKHFNKSDEANNSQFSQCIQTSRDTLQSKYHQDCGMLYQVDHNIGIVMFAGGKAEIKAISHYSRWSLTLAVSISSDNI